MTPEERALLALTIIVADADMIDGDRYSPDLRDNLHGALDWAAPIVAVTIREAMAAARLEALEEAERAVDELVILTRDDDPPDWAYQPSTYALEEAVRAIRALKDSKGAAALE